MSRKLQSILYVEDEPDIQVVARLALEQVGGFEVVICSNGREALKALGRFRPDLVLLDAMMPVLDGEATLAALRKHPVGADLPVVFVTARVHAREVMRYKELGAIGVIAKPFDPMLLSAKVTAIWEEHIDPPRS
jgi:two-component system, OmpR family, response regulator